MGLSLAEAAVRGTSIPALDDQKRMLLDAGDIQGLMALNRARFGGFSMMADSDDDSDDDGDDGDDDGDDGDDDSDDDGDDDGDDDADDKAKGKKPDAKDLRIKDLSAEAKKYRLRASARGKRIRDLEAEVAALKGKPKAKKEEGDDGDDDSSADVAEAKKENQVLARQNEDLLIRLEFMADDRYNWVNAKAALRLLDLDDVEITEDGEVEGLEEAIDDLAKEHPYLLKSKDDEDLDEDGKPKPKRKVGQRTGGKKKGTPNRDALVKKYPALRR